MKAMWAAHAEEILRKSLLLGLEDSVMDSALPYHPELKLETNVVSHTQDAGDLRDGEAEGLEGEGCRSQADDAVGSGRVRKGAGQVDEPPGDQHCFRISVHLQSTAPDEPVAPLIVRGQRTELDPEFGIR